MIADVIREVESEHEVYFLLTAYIESVRFGDRLSLLSEPLTRLPLTGIDDVRERFQKLMVELDTASKRLNDNTCVVIKEALHIFGTALAQLKSLEGKKNRSVAEAVRALSTSNPVPGIPATSERRPPPLSEGVQG